MPAPASSNVFFTAGSGMTAPGSVSIIRVVPDGPRMDQGRRRSLCAISRCSSNSSMVRGVPCSAR